MARAYSRSLPLIVALALPALSGCQTAGGQAAKAPGRSSSLLERRNLTVSPVPLPRTPFYGPVDQCSYSQMEAVPGSPASVSTISITVRPVRDKFMIAISQGGRMSSILITRDGTLRDFNVLDRSGTRLTTETYSEEANRRLAATGKPGVMINQITAAFPHYLLPVWKPGSVVAAVQSQDGKDWAQMVYRGLATYKGSTAAVLDMVPAGAPTPENATLIGYNLIDVSTMMPLLYVFETSNRVRLERLSCP
jgi:hypothetical protein